MAIKHITDEIRGIWEAVPTGTVSVQQAILVIGESQALTLNALERLDGEVEMINAVQKRILDEIDQLRLVEADGDLENLPVGTP